MPAIIIKTHVYPPSQGILHRSGRAGPSGLAARLGWCPMRVVWWLLGIAVLVSLGLAGAVAWWLQRPLPLAAQTVELSIEPGTPPREVAQAWVKAGVQTSPWMLYHWFRASGDARRIRAGSYVLSPGVSPRDLLAKMVQGDEAFERVRLIEGWTFRQFRAELARAPHLKPVTSQMTEAELMAALGRSGQADRKSVV
jgi:UPF0755 protein